MTLIMLYSLSILPLLPSSVKCTVKSDITKHSRISIFLQWFFLLVRTFPNPRALAELLEPTLALCCSAETGIILDLRRSTLLSFSDWRHAPRIQTVTYKLSHMRSRLMNFMNVIAKLVLSWMGRRATIHNQVSVTYFLVLFIVILSTVWPHPPGHAHWVGWEECGWKMTP